MKLSLYVDDGWSIRNRTKQFGVQRVRASQNAHAEPGGAIDDGERLSERRVPSGRVFEGSACS